MKTAMYDPKNKIAKAVAPLRQRAIDGARSRAAEKINWLKEEIVKVGGRIDEYAPEPRPYSNKNHPAYGTPAYQAMRAKRAFVYVLFTARQKSVLDESPTVVDLDHKKAAEYVERCVLGSAASYDAWVHKLVEKIGVVTGAKLRDNQADLWGFSYLEVISVKRGPEVWKTQEIWNVSKLGLYFNQWPTRKMKNESLKTNLRKRI